MRQKQSWLELRLGHNSSAAWLARARAQDQFSTLKPGVACQRICITERQRIALNNIQDLNQKLLKNTVLNDLTFSCCSSEDGRNMIQIPNLVISLPAQLHQRGIFMS